MEIFSLFGSILLKDNDTKNKLKDIDSTAQKTGNTFDSVFSKVENTATKLGRSVGAVFDNLDKKFQLWMEDNKKSASSTEINSKALENYKGKLQALSQELEKSQKALKGVAEEFGKDSTEYKEAENHVMDLQLKYKQLEDESKKLQKANDSINFKKIADGAISVGSAMTMKFTTPILAAFGMASTSASSFEHQMADIRKEIVAQGMPIAQVNSLMSQMSKSSIQWSEDFGQSTENINESLLTLVKDGYSGSEAMQFMHKSLYAARGANEDLAPTVDGLGSSLEAFGMKTNNAAQTVQNMSKLTDAFAYISNHTKASIGSLSEASSIMGSTCTALKIPMTQAAAAIGELQSNGIDASTAANALKAGLVNLVHPSKQMSAAMKEMKLNAFDAKGQMKDLPTILSDIEKGTQGWTDKQKQAAIATIFGKESLSTWNVLIHKGSGYLSELSTSAGNATGEVEKLSNAMKDTPENKFKEFKESVHALGVAFGQDVLPVLTPFVEALTSMIKAFSNLDDGTKKMILTFAGIVAVTGPVLSIFGGLYDKISGLNEFLVSKNIGEKLAGIFTKMPKVSAGGMFAGLTSGLSSAGSAISKFIFGPWALLGNGLKSLPGLIKNFSFGNVIEKALLPFKSIPGLFGKIPGLLTGLKTVFTGFGATIIGLGPKVLLAIKKMFSIQGIMTGAKTALSLFTNPWGALILVIMAGVGAIIANWSKIQAFANKIFNGNLKQTFTQFKNFFVQIWDSIKNNAVAVWNYIGPTIIGAVNRIKVFWNQTWPLLKQVFVEVWNGMKIVLAPIITALYVIISTGLGAIKGAWSSAWNAIKDTLKLVWDTMAGVIKVAWDLISGIIKVGLDLATGHWSQAWKDFKNIFSNVWSDLKTSVGNIAKDALNWGKDIINGIINGIKGGIKALGDAVKNVAETIWKYLHHSVPEEGLLADDDTWMPDFMQNMADGITDNTEIVTDALEKLTKKIKSKAQIKAPAITTSSTDSSQNANTSLNSGLSNNQDQAVSPLNALGSKMSNVMGGLANKFTQNGQQLNTNLGKGIADNSGATLTPLNNLLTKVTVPINTFIQKAINHGQDTDTNLGTGITNNAGVVADSMKNITNTVGNNLNDFSAGSVKYGTQTDTSIANGVASTANTVMSAINNVTSKIGSILNTFAQSCTTYGNSIINSISTGVQSTEGNLISVVNELTQKVIEAFKNGFDVHSPSRILYWIGTQLPAGLMNGIKSKDLGGFINKWLSSITGNLSGKVGEWLAAALAITGQPLSALPALEEIAEHESSGDPLSVNDWDINAQRGDPSEGLMQVTISNFRDFHLPELDNIFNGIDNAVAAIRYMIATYGSIWNVPGVRSLASGGGYKPYATGTDSATPGPHLTGENGFEIVLDKTIKWFKGGETVLNNKDSIKFISDLIAKIKDSINNFTASYLEGLSSNLTVPKISFAGIPNTFVDIPSKETNTEESNSSEDKESQVQFIFKGNYCFMDKKSMDEFIQKVSNVISLNIKRRRK